MANKRAGSITAKLIGKKFAENMLIFCPFLGYGLIKRFDWLRKKVLRKNKVKLLGIIMQKKADFGNCAYLKEFHASDLLQHIVT